MSYYELGMKISNEIHKDMQTVIDKKGLEIAIFYNEEKALEFIVAQAEIARLQSALDVAVEGLEHYKNHKSVIGEAYQTETKQLVVVHTFINHHARAALDKIKLIREKK